MYFSEKCSINARLADSAQIVHTLTGCMSNFLLLVWRRLVIYPNIIVYFSAFLKSLFISVIFPLGNSECKIKDLIESVELTAVGERSARYLGSISGKASKCI